MLLLSCLIHSTEHNKRSCAQQSLSKAKPTTTQLQPQANKQTHRHTQAHTTTHIQTQAQRQSQHACPVVSLQRNLAGRNKNTAAVSALEVRVPAHSAVVLADWLVQLHTTARNVLCGVPAIEPQHTATRVPLHTHALAHVILGRKLACIAEAQRKVSGVERSRAFATPPLIVLQCCGTHPLALRPRIRLRRCSRTRHRQPAKQQKEDQDSRGL